MPRLSERRKRVKRALEGMERGRLVTLYGDTYNIRTPASPAIGAVCKILRVDKSQPDLQVLIQDINHRSKVEWVSALDLELCPPHWTESMFRQETG